MPDVKALEDVAVSFILEDLLEKVIHIITLLFFPLLYNQILAQRFAD